MGTGTISWPSDTLFNIENDEIDDFISSAYGINDIYLFDTAERHR